MSEKKLSLFELHFHDSVQFGPRTLDGLGGAPDAGDEQPSGLPSEEEPPVLDKEGAEADDNGSNLVRRLVGLGVLAAPAYAVRKLLGSEPSGLDALDDIEAGIGAADEPAEHNESVSIEVTSGEDSGSESSMGPGRTGLAVAAVVALLVVVALAARKLLGDAVEEIEVPDELAEE